MSRVRIPGAGLQPSRRGVFVATLAGWIVLGALAHGTAGAQVRITEVLTNPVGANDTFQKVELTNVGNAVVSMNGWWVCQNFKYQPFPAGTSLDPGETFVIHHRGTGTNDANNWYVTGTLTQMVVAGESYAIYSSSQFANPAAMRDYVGWGAGGQDREIEAVAAGLWTAGDFAPVAPEGQSIQLCNPTGHAGSDWFVADPTIGGPNDCAAPPPKVVLNEILVHPVGGDTASQLVEIENRDSSPVDLFDWRITYQVLDWVFPSLVLNPGDKVVVHLDAIGIDTATDLYTGPLANALEDAEALSLYLPITIPADLDDPEFIIDFAQWGGTGLTHEDVAAAAGLWVAGDSLEAPALGHSLERCADAPGVASWSETPDLTFGADNTCSALQVFPGTPRVTFVGSAVPNPMVDCTFIDFDLSSPARVVARVRDVRGRVLKVIADRQFSAGRQTLGWEGVDSRLRQQAPGVYFVEIWSPEALDADDKPLHEVRRVVKLWP